ncbi:MAG: hypothetical protein ABI140_14730 [Jatrophihabitantaceae bacterium]
MLYLAAVAIVFGVNLLPAFGPPTWALLVLFKLNWHLNSVALVILGAIAAGGGRYLLARLCLLLRSRFSQQRRDNLAAAQTHLTGHRGGAALGLGLFALSPLPSAQLFEAAGVLALPLRQLTAAFFVGRLVSYSIYVGAATVAQRSYGQVITSALTSPVGVGLQVVMLLAIAGISQINWRSRLPGAAG